MSNGIGFMVLRTFLLGDDKTFGKLLFDFGDETVIFNIYIMDRDKILDAAHVAIAHFSDPEHEVFLHEDAQLHR